MPASVYATTRKPYTDLILRLSSPDGDVKLKALREVKNQIIGNRTRKLAFVKLGVVPAVVEVLSSTSDAGLLVQCAAVLGSFSIGGDAGVKAVLDAGAFPHVLRLLSSPSEKVMDAGARSLRMVYQSQHAPKFDFLQERNMEFLLTLLDSANENVRGLGATIITHSCEIANEQKVLYDAGVLEKLIVLLDGSPSQRDACLQSLATVLRNNVEVVSRFMENSGSRYLSTIIERIRDKNPRTKLLACKCVIDIRNTSLCYLQDTVIKRKLIHNLIELLEDPGEVGNEATIVFSNLIDEEEDLQKLALEQDVIDSLYNHLQQDSIHPKRLEGMLLAMANVCSKLECCRSRFISLQVLDLVMDTLTHDSTDIRIAACTCLRKVCRSIKNLNAGHFMNETVITPLLQLLQDPSSSAKVAALGAISNIVLDLTTQRATFVKCGGVKELVQLSKSMDSTIRANALCALRNLMFLADNTLKQEIFLEISAASLASLVCDSDPKVQEQAMALIRNLVNGSIDCVEYAFAEEGIILDAIGKQMQRCSKSEVLIQGMYVLCNVASGTEFHKEAVMQQLFPPVDSGTGSFISNFLRSNDRQLRTATMWTIVNLTFPSSSSAPCRAARLHNAGVGSQLKGIFNDPCLDVQLCARRALEQLSLIGDGLTSTPNSGKETTGVFS